MEKVIYTDGSCLSNPGPGGWAFCILGDEHDDVVSDGEPQTTNNRMELIAVIEALKELASINCKNCIIHSDSKLTINCCNNTWKRNTNTDLWNLYDSISQIFDKIEFKWVKAHSGNKYNDIVDKAAQKAAKNIQIWKSNQEWLM
jgi:ribonuclease HI